MRIKGHSGGLAVALSALAVVIAGAGTAVAVSATVVRIEDGSTAHYAHVDTAGRLATGPALSDINIQQITPVDNMSFVTDPTRATFALTRLSYFNTKQNQSYANTNFAFTLKQVVVGSHGHCYDSDSSTGATYTTNEVPAGETVENSYPSPLVVGPIGTKRYCLALVAFQYGTSAASYYTPQFELSGYVLKGTYTGVGTAANPSRNLAKPQLITRRQGTTH
jgi:hypothetical protein